MATCSASTTAPSEATVASLADLELQAELFSTVEWMESQAETVVLDAPPLFAVSDIYTLAKNVDAVVLTARAGKTTKSELQEMLSVLGQVDANVVGVVLVGSRRTWGHTAHTRVPASRIRPPGRPMADRRPHQRP